MFKLLISYHYFHLNVRFQYKADIRVECFERLLSSVSGPSARDIELVLSAKSGRSLVLDA
jgi:hypothetical protein